MTTPRDKQKKPGPARGILITTAVALTSLGIGGYLALSPIREAKQLEQDLLDRHATVPEYTPAPDGSIAAERLEIFVAVRQGLLAKTGNVQATYSRIDNAMSQEELSAEESVSTIKDLLHALPRMVEFYRVRNGELLERGMGLGEYFYIFVAAYGSQLCPPDANGSCEFVTRRTTRELTQMLRNQLENPAANMDTGMVEILELEIASLERGELSLPWQRQLPLTVSMSLEPYRDQLDSLFCSATRELELGQKNKRIGGIGE
jgi:hypothetical protein